MVKAVTRRFMFGAALVAAIGGTLIASAAAPATAAPQTTAVTVSGEGFTEPVTVRADTDPEVFAALLDQVSWLRGTGHAGPPKDADLGPKFTVVVLVDDAASQTYDLYPLAAGGPRAFRPASQPNQRKTSAAWFFGRLNMSEALRAAGAPLPEQAAVLTSRIGGDDRVFQDGDLDSADGFDQLMHDLRRLILLNGAVVLVIATGLAGISLLSRRRTR